MNPPTEDQDLDDYLSGRSEISRQYRSTAGEEPPAELDRAILAQARAAVSSAPSKVLGFPRRFTARRLVPFAIAATVILSFTLVQEVGIREATVSSDAPQESAPLAVPPSAERRSEESFEQTTPQAAGKMADAVATPAAAPAPARLKLPELDKALAADSGGIGAAQEAEAQPSMSRAVEPVPLPEASNVPPASTANASQAVIARELKKERAGVQFRAPEVWLEDIRKLRRSDRQIEAEAELKLFLEAYPDYFDKNPSVARP